VNDDRHVTIEAHGETLAEATISNPDDDAAVRVAVHMASGHLPAGARHRLTEAIHEVVLDDHAERLTATVPLGDAELVEGIREHLSDPELRAAGSTSIIQGDVAPVEQPGRS